MHPKCSTLVQGANLNRTYNYNGRTMDAHRCEPKLYVHPVLPSAHWEGRYGGLRHFKHLRSFPDAIETWNREEIPFPSRIVPRGLSVPEGP